MDVDFTKMEGKVKSQMSGFLPEIKLLGTQTFRMQSETPNYALQCRTCSAMFSPDYKDCPNCNK